MRRFVSLLLTVFILLLPVGTWGEGEPVEVSASAWCLTLPGRAEPLLDKKGTEPMSVAGLRKLPAVLTLCRAFDSGLIAESTGMQVSPHAASISGPTAFLESGERIEAGELLKAAVMISAGDAIVTLGENAFGSESVFLNNIQVTLKELGIDRTLTDCLARASPSLRWTCAPWALPPQRASTSAAGRGSTWSISSIPGGGRRSWSTPTG